MKSYLIFIFLLLELASCSKQRDKYKGGNLDDPNYIYDRYTWNFADDDDLDVIFIPQYSKKANIIKDNSSGKIQYFTVDSAELKSIKKTLYGFLATNDSLYTLRRYFRQFIGYQMGNRKFVYVNLYTHMQCRGEAQPPTDKIIYTENEGQCDFGHIVIDLDLNEVTECEFINEPF